MQLVLNPEKTGKLADSLNDLLANYQLFYINVRGFHWNITGEKFFELHAKFEEIYNDALLNDFLSLDKLEQGNVEIDIEALNLRMNHY